MYMVKSQTITTQYPNLILQYATAEKLTRVFLKISENPLLKSFHFSHCFLRGVFLKRNLTFMYKNTPCENSVATEEMYVVF